MKQWLIILVLVLLLTGSVIISGCSSLVNSQDLRFLSSLQEFQNESVTRIGQIQKEVNLQQWEKVKANLTDYQRIIRAEIMDLNSLQVSEKLVPIRDQAVIALEKQEIVLHSVQNLSELNDTVISDIAGDYLSVVIDTAIKSVLSGE